MKKWILVTLSLLLIFVLSTSTFAQGIKVGIKGGVNLSKVVNKDLTIKPDYKKGFSGGFFASFGLGPLAFQPEALFTMKGAQLKEELLSVVNNVNINMNYLEIPILAKISIPLTKGVRINLLAGPSVALKLSAKSVSEIAGKSVDENIKDMKNTDFGLAFGGGIKFGALSIEGRYTPGLTSIGKSQTGIFQSINSGTKNSVITLTAEYLFYGM